MRKAIVIALLCVASTAWADQGVGIGLFVGEPLGLDLKLGLGYRSNLDIVLGWAFAAAVICAINRYDRWRRERRPREPMVNTVEAWPRD